MVSYLCVMIPGGPKHLRPREGFFEGQQQTAKKSGGAVSSVAAEPRRSPTAWSCSTTHGSPYELSSVIITPVSAALRRLPNRPDLTQRFAATGMKPHWASFKKVYDVPCFTRVALCRTCKLLAMSPGSQNWVKQCTTTFHFNDYVENKKQSEKSRRG